MARSRIHVVLAALLCALVVPAEGEVPGGWEFFDETSVAQMVEVCDVVIQARIDGVEIEPLGGPQSRGLVTFTVQRVFRRPVEGELEVGDEIRGRLYTDMVPQDEEAAKRYVERINAHLIGSERFCFFRSDRERDGVFEIEWIDCVRMHPLTERRILDAVDRVEAAEEGEKGRPD